MIRTYDELMRFDTFLDRYRYLKLSGEVGARTFGSERYLNQGFYKSREWQDIRHHVIARDEALDMGFYENPIPGRIVIHHMNPMRSHDLLEGNEDVLDPRFLISVSHNTHNAIHYGNEDLLPVPYVPRRPGDTRSW